MMLSLSFWRGFYCISMVNCHAEYSIHSPQKLMNILKLCPGLKIGYNGSCHPIDHWRQFPNSTQWKYLSEDFATFTRSILLTSNCLLCCYETAYWTSLTYWFVRVASIWHYSRMTHSNCLSRAYSLLIILIDSYAAGKIPSELTFPVSLSHLF